MKIPRWMHKAYANLFSYFWLPCPLCGKEFGGHESKGDYIITGLGTGEGVCPNCGEKAQEYNESVISR